MKKRLKWVLGILVAGFVLLQLISPARPNHPVLPGHDVLATNPPPAEIAAMIRTACYDCHSYETHWPWYGHVAPVSWWLDSHVSDARESVNFSEWPQGEPQRAAKKWRRIGEAVRDGSMPLPSYARIHKAARLSEAQRKQLADWAEQEAEWLKGADAPTR